MAFKDNGMVRTLREMTGNARACILTEPLWGIPYNLCAAYASLYMGALGLSNADIGLIGSLYLAVAVVASVLSGVITDKLGRKRTTLWFDMLIWSVPELLWAFAQNKAWFVAAAMLNGLMRITGNSWGLLLVEDSEDEMVLKFNSLAQMMGLVTVFIAPLSGLAVGAFGIVATMRVLYLMGFVMMTAKFIILNFMCTETQVGAQRMIETKDQSLLSLLMSCKDVYLHLMKEKRILLTMALIAVFQIVSKLNELYMGLYAHNAIGLAQANWVWVTSLKSIITLSCVFVVVPRIRLASFKRPMLMAWALFMAGQLLLVLAPQGRVGIGMLLADAVCEGFALSILSPIIDAMLVINADPTRRARIYGLVYGTILVPVTVFPMIAGRLSELLPAAPFVINLVMLALGAGLTVMLAREQKADAGVSA